MSLLAQNFSDDFIKSASSNERVQLMKDMIVEYQETRTKLEFSCLVDRIRGERKGGAS